MKDDDEIKHPVEGTTMMWPFDIYQDEHGTIHIIDANKRTVLSDAYAYGDDIKDPDKQAERVKVMMRALNRQLGPVLIAEEANAAIWALQAQVDRLKEELAVEKMDCEALRRYRRAMEGLRDDESGLMADED